MTELEPISPARAMQLYENERKEDASYDTRQKINQSIGLFVEWSELAGIENMNNLTGRGLVEFKDWCKEESENNIVSLNGLLANVRRFLVFCVRIEAVESNLPDKTPIPNVPDDEDVCNVKPTDEEVKAITTYFETHSPFSRKHVEYAVIREVGCRLGAIRGIDVKDIDVDDRVIKYRHRPMKDHPGVKGTPLKNGSDSERNINISTELAEVIDGYLSNPHRHDVMDEFGRNPLLTSKDGRVATTTIRRDFYKMSRPCSYSSECPHDRDMNSCEAEINDNASECPSSKSPHPLRRWSIEHQIDKGVSKELISERVDVSVPTLNEHYDTRSKERKRKNRLLRYEKLFEGYGDPDATIDADDLEKITNKHGMIDPEALLAAEFDNAGKESPEEPTPNVESDSESSLGQATFDKFNGVVQPPLVPVLAGVAVGQWLPDRLRREMVSMAPDSDPSPCPSPQRAAKGVAAYLLFVCLIALNFVMVGLTTVSFY